MILEYSVENTLSIKEKQTISFEPVKPSKEDNNHYIEYGGKKFLKFACIYGANASGKTNIAKSFNYYLGFILSSFTDLKPDEKTHFSPFMFDKETQTNPGVFELIFYANDFDSENIVRYDYAIKIDKNKVLEESLFYYPKGKRSKIFERDSNLNIKWGYGIKGVKKVISEMTRHNCSVISSGAQARHNALLHVYTHLSNRYIGFVDSSFGIPYGYSTKRMNNDVDFKDIVRRLLSYADFGNISDIKIDKELLPDSLLKTIPDDIKQQVEEYVYKVTLLHNYGNNSCSLPFSQESAGTIKIMELSAPLMDIMTKPSLCLVDELETSLHLDLQEMILKLFLEVSEYSQLLFTTHNQDLLDSDILRNDEIWFCNKTENGNSVYYSITDYKGIRKDISRKTLYRADKFGALPNIDFNSLKEMLNGQKNKQD